MLISKTSFKEPLLFSLAWEIQLGIGIPRDRSLFRQTTVHFRRTVHFPSFGPFNFPESFTLFARYKLFVLFAVRTVRSVWSLRMVRCSHCSFSANCLHGSLSANCLHGSLFAHFGMFAFRWTLNNAMFIDMLELSAWKYLWINDDLSSSNGLDFESWNMQRCWKRCHPFCDEFPFHFVLKTQGT